MRNCVYFWVEFNGTDCTLVLYVAVKTIMDLFTDLTTLQVILWNDAFTIIWTRLCVGWIGWPSCQSWILGKDGRCIWCHAANYWKFVYSLPYHSVLYGSKYCTTVTLYGRRYPDWWSCKCNYCNENAFYTIIVQFNFSSTHHSINIILQVIFAGVMGIASSKKRTNCMVSYGTWSITDPKRTAIVRFIKCKKITWWNIFQTLGFLVLSVLAGLFALFPMVFGVMGATMMIDQKLMVNIHVISLIFHYISAWIICKMKLQRLY